MLQLNNLNNISDNIEVEPQLQESKLLRIKKALEADFKKMDSSDNENEENNINFLKLKKSIQDDYNKNMFKYVDNDDFNLLKSYFNRILENGSELSIENINSILDEYIENSDNEPFTRIIKNIKVDLTSNKLNQDEFFNFIQKFKDQQYPLDIFYKKFFKRSPFPSKPTLTEIFGDELEDLSSTSDSDTSTDNENTERSKLRKIRARIEKKREEPKVTQVISSPQQQGKVTLIQDNMPVPPPKVPEVKPISDKIFFETMVDVSKKDCEFLYKKIPWVKDIINHIYVHPISDNFDNVVDFNNFIEYDNVKFYQPKQKYYDIQCYSHKVQEGNELTIIKNEETYKLMVAIDTNTKGIVLQNEDMLKAEIDYIRVWNQNKNDHIKDLKKNKPNEEMIILGKFDLSNILVDSIGGNVPIVYRSSNSPFIETVINTILKNSKSGDSFVRLLANLIIFLKINVSFITSSVFIKRLREQIYLPGTLPFLTDADKLPEIFLVKNVPDTTRNFVLEKLEEERLNFTKEFFENLYIGSSMIRKPVKPILWNKPTQQIELPDIKTICKNKADIEDENDEDIVFYTDLDEVYCFNVFKLYDLFKKDEIPTNPYTRRPFSDKFIQIFLTRYASKPLVKKIERTQHIDLTSKLEQLIEKELNILENNLIEVENPEFIERFKSSTIVEKKRISHIAPKENKTEEPTKCMECKNELGTSKINSFFRNKQVSFCGYECLEKNKAFK